MEQVRMLDGGEVVGEQVDGTNYIATWIPVKPHPPITVMISVESARNPLNPVQWKFERTMSQPEFSQNVHLRMLPTISDLIFRQLLILNFTIVRARHLRQWAHQLWFLATPSQHLTELMEAVTADQTTWILPSPSGLSSCNSQKLQNQALDDFQFHENASSKPVVMRVQLDKASMRLKESCNYNSERPSSMRLGCSCGSNECLYNWSTLWSSATSCLVSATSLGLSSCDSFVSPSET